MTELGSRPNREPCVTWLLRREYGRGFVMTRAGDRILLALPSSDTGQLVGVELGRNDARLLAKRIVQCLDETRLR